MSAQGPPRVRLADMPALDALRALAVAGVMAFHAGALPGGFLGVELFFVLSGFLITSLLAAELARDGGLRLGRFWARRLRRLTPALLLTLLGVAGYAAWLARPAELLRIRGDALATLAYVGNWQSLLQGQDYWALFVRPSPLLHAWSLAIEGQFYLLWPLALYGLRRGLGLGWGALALGALALAGASSLAMGLAFAGGEGAARAFYGSDTRAAALLVGAALALARQARPGPLGPRLARWLPAATGLALLLLGAAWALLAGHSPLLYRGGFLLHAGLAALLVLAASAYDPGPLAPARLGRHLALALLGYLGRISYGLYLWHWPVYLALDSALAALGPAPRLLFKLVLSLVLAVASYHLLELPVRRGAFPGLRAPVVGLLAVAAVVWATLAATADGLRLAPGAAEAQPPAPSAGALEAPPAAGPARLLVVGDSVAELLGPVLAALRPDGAIASRGRAECGLLQGTRRVRLEDNSVSTRGAACPDWREDWPRALDEVRPEVVLLVLGEIAQGDWELDGRWLHPCQPEFDRRYTAELEAALELLGARGAVVVVATSAYSQWDGKPAWLDERTDCLNEAVRDAVAASPWSEVLELQPFVCPSRACVRRVAGEELRPDGVHYAGPGARWVAAWILERLAALPRAELARNHPARR